MRQRRGREAAGISGWMRQQRRRPSGAAAEQPSPFCGAQLACSLPRRQGPTQSTGAARQDCSQRGRACAAKPAGPAAAPGTSPSAAPTSSQPHLASGAGALKSIVLTAALLPLPQRPRQRKVTLCDLLSCKGREWFGTGLVGAGRPACTRLGAGAALHTCRVWPGQGQRAPRICAAHLRQAAAASRNGAAPTFWDVVQCPELDGSVGGGGGVLAGRPVKAVKARHVGQALVVDQRGLRVQAGATHAPLALRSRQEPGTEVPTLGPNR